MSLDRQSVVADKYGFQVLPPLVPNLDGTAPDRSDVLGLCGESIMGMFLKKVVVIRSGTIHEH